MTRRLLWVAPLLAALALFAAVLALPWFVASGAHRATIEALASSLTGRRVVIGGKLSLALLPAPRIIAERVVISGPAGPLVTARSLTLDIAAAPLLRGRLAARDITLQAPVITLPWPLPGGLAAALPPWLGALHATISGGTLTLGALAASDVNADIFTGGNGALSVSGTGMVGGGPLTLSLALGAFNASGRAPLAIDSRTPDGKLGGHFSGRIDLAGDIAGTLIARFVPPGGAASSIVASIAADPARLTASGIRLAQGSAALTGDASFGLAEPGYAATLAGDGLDLTALAPLFAAGMAGPPGTLDLSITNTRLRFGVLPELRAKLAFGGGLTLREVTATLPGEGGATLTGALDRTGRFTGAATLATADLPAVLSALDIAVPAAVASAGWSSVRLAADVAGDARRVGFTHIAGELGPSHVFGSVVIQRQSGAIGGDLAFDVLDLAPVVALLRQAPAADGFSLAGELTADRANDGGLILNRLLLDVAIDHRLIVRRLSAALYGGVALTDFSLAPDGGLTAGRAMLAVPSAAPLLALAGAARLLPPLLSHAPLRLYVAASGAATDLAASAVASLGAYDVTAAPVINLAAGTAAGPFTLRHPDAIAAMAPFDAAAGLAWPGAGSISLRANMALAPGRFALPDFILSFGDTTADGSVSVTSGRRVSADIIAGTLALPPFSAAPAIPWPPLMSATGKMAVSAGQIWLGGDPILGPSAASVTLAPGAVNLVLTQASIGQGALTGALAATMQDGAPSLSLKLNLAHADAASLAPPVAFPYTLPTGTVAAQAALHATGHAPAAWVATLAGSVSLTARDGALSGFDLAALARALAMQTETGWRDAATSGTTQVTSLALAGMIDHGTLTLGSSSLASPAGGATATGAIDLPDRVLNLALALTPAATPPETINVTTIGGWLSPKHILPKTP